MKIEHVRIDGFGVWSQLELGNLDRELNVFYGPNEAGKTTLLEFIRSIIFGFASGRRKRYLPPVSGGVGGGSLAVNSPQGDCELVRHDGGSDPVEGQLRIVGADGTLRSEHVLASLLCGVDEATFNNVFAVGLRDIQELGTLGDTAAAEMLYGLTTGLDRVSLAEVLRELAASRARIMVDDGRPSQLAQLAAQRERVLHELGQLRSHTRDYADLLARRDAIDGQVGQIESEAGELDRAAHLLDTAAAVREKWQRRKQLEAQLAALGNPASLPKRMLEQFDRLVTSCRRRRRRNVGLRRKLQDAREQLSELAARPLVARLAPRIEALVEQRPWAASLAAELGRHDAEIAQLDARIHRDAASIGAAGSPAAAATPIARKTLVRLKQVAATLADVGKRKKAAFDEAERAKSTAAELAEQVRAALAGRPEKELTSAIEHAGTLVTQLRRRVQLDERLEQMARGRGDLENHGHDLLQRQVMPLGVLAGLGGLFVVGVTLVLSGLFLHGTFFGPVGWTLALLGLGGTCAAAGSKFYFERTAAQQLDAGQKQLGLLEGQIAQAKEERDALDRQLPKGGGPLLTRLQAAEKELARLEELLVLDGKRSVAQQQAESARSHAGQLRTEQHRAQRKWQHYLATAGLPADTRPSALRLLMRSRRTRSESTARLDRLRIEADGRRRDLDGFVGRIRQLLAELEIKPSGTGFDDHLRQLEDTLREHHAQLADRERWRARAEELRRLQRKNLRQLRQLRRRRTALLRRARVRNAHDFRQRAIQAVQAAALRSERDRLAGEIAAALGPHWAEEHLHEPLERLAPLEFEAQTRDLAGRRQVMRQQLQQLSEERGQLSARLRILAEDRRASEKLLELGTIDRQMRTCIERWQVLAVAGRMLDQIRRTYEADRQPATLQEASGYLRQLTDGRYQRVWTPVDEHLLLVDDANGQPLPVEVLSSGTREQLFLSLRLALASAYARRGASLPLVLDDVLVNFDTGRARATARVLRDFAAGGYQLLVFTCHEHIAQLFEQLKVQPRELPTRTASESRPAKRSRKPPRTADHEPEIERKSLEPAAVLKALEPESQPELEGDGDEGVLVPVRPKKSKSRRGQAKKKRRQGDSKSREPFASAVWHEPVEDEAGESAAAAEPVEPDDEDVIWHSGAADDDEAYRDTFAGFDDDEAA